MNDTTHFSFRGVARLSLAISLTLYGLHLYYFCYPLFDSLHWTGRLGDKTPHADRSDRVV